MAYASGVITVGTSRTQVANISIHGAMVQNVGGTTIYIGGPNVTADATATGGIQLLSGASPPAPLAINGGITQQGLSGTFVDTATLWAISSGAGGKLAYLCETDPF